jgi:CO/xanthine dehydrogenase Mo-binding subunit
MEIEFNIDGGAYCTLSPVVLSRGTIHAAGPYNCPNVRIRSRALATNFPPHGAFRGFGAPQSIFALERHMNKVAAAVGLAPDEFRRRNFLHEGEQTATGQVIRERLNLQGLLARALDLSGYCAKRTQFDKSNSGSPVKQGVGFATFMHGAGFTGSGEVALKSVVTVEATRAGHVRILTASTEIGQGTNTIFSQIAAEALDLPYDQIELAQPDTAEVPNSGPTVASRTVMVVGKLVEAACVSLKQLVGAKNGDFAAAAARYFEQFGKVARASSEYQPPPGAGWNDETYQGDAYGAYAWAVYVATVSVDTRTYETRVDDFVALQEIGKVIHPVLAAGQIEGGVAQAIGFALYENCVWKDGRMANAQMTNYIMPTSADLPPIRVFFEENPYAYGPAGAKGIGELPMDGVAPAILNAVEHATGVSVNRIPMTPEILMQAMLEEKHG